MQTVVLNGIYFPVVDFLSSLATAVVLGYGGWLVFTRARLDRHARRVPRLPGELLRPGAAAVAALQHLPVRGRGARQDHRPARRGARRRRRRRRGRARRDRGPRALRGRAFLLQPRARRCCTASISTSPPARPSRSSGHTGAGKSTIAKLLARFYDPTTGAITIDGVDLRDVSQESLRRQLGIVPQEGFLFAGTVAENIAFGRPGRRPARRSTPPPRAVGADEFIRAARGRLRHAARRARLTALARSAATGRVRPRAARRPADPDPRRGDELRRHRHRAEDRDRAAPAAARPNRVHHRPPALDDPRRRPDRRARERAASSSRERTTSCSPAKGLYTRALRRLGCRRGLRSRDRSASEPTALSCQVWCLGSQSIQR